MRKKRTCTFIVLSALWCLFIMGACSIRSSSPVGPSHVNANPINETQMNASVLAEQTARSILGVASASAIVYEKDIIVGLRLSNYTRSKKSIEQDVQTAVSRQFPGYSVYITSSRTLYSRIRLLCSQIEQGRPYATIAGSVEEMIKALSSPAS
ncbi:YhcN/YlaJ family sporulation lipoprotein [Aneurinibacillus sp. REN35]|uniref:YhcN/YlaJ family sporulation lipoprotein n=1 Tax=Aneurinibacillus sp. REN35 TaxID=3237286 RepID=UPI003529CD82